MDFTGMSFTGLSAFPITPADADGQVHTDDFARLLARLDARYVQSVAVLGSTGTYAYLSRTERARAVAAAAEALGGRLPLIVGVGALRTDAAIALARDAEARGADGLLLAPMSYTPLTEEEVFQHYRAVAGATGLPLCVYDNPGTTHCPIGPDLLARLATIPSITAVKLPLPATGGLAADLTRRRAALPERVSIGYSGDWGCAEAMLAGADCWYSVIAGLLPAPAARLAEAARAGDAAETARLDARLAPLWRLFRELGSLRVVYAAARLLDLTRAEPPRPILPLGFGDDARVAAALDALAS